MLYLQRRDDTSLVWGKFTVGRNSRSVEARWHAPETDTPRCKLGPKPADGLPLLLSLICRRRTGGCRWDTAGSRATGFQASPSYRHRGHAISGRSRARPRLFAGLSRGPSLGGRRCSRERHPRCPGVVVLGPALERRNPPPHHHRQWATANRHDDDSTRLLRMYCTPGRAFRRNPVRLGIRHVVAAATVTPTVAHAPVRPADNVSDSELNPGFDLQD